MLGAFVNSSYPRRLVYILLNDLFVLHQKKELIGNKIFETKLNELIEKINPSQKNNIKKKSKQLEDSGN